MWRGRAGLGGEQRGRCSSSGATGGEVSVSNLPVAGFQPIWPAMNTSLPLGGDAVGEALAPAPSPAAAGSASSLRFLSLNRCSLPVSVRGSASTNSIARGYLYGAMGCFTCSCSFSHRARPGLDARFRTTKALTMCRAPRPAADHAAFGDRRMREQRALHLGAGDVVARRDDHVVGARLVEEVAVLVDQVGVAGDVPAVLHVVALPLVGEVAAAGRALHREPPDLARARTGCPPRRAPRAS